MDEVSFRRSFVSRRGDGNCWEIAGEIEYKKEYACKKIDLRIARVVLGYFSEIRGREGGEIVFKNCEKIMRITGSLDPPFLISALEEKERKRRSRKSCKFISNTIISNVRRRFENFGKLNDLSLYWTKKERKENGGL